MILKIITLLFLLTYTQSFSQKQTMNPKNGEISFSWLKKDSVLNVLHVAGERIEPIREQKFIHEFQDSIIRLFSIFRRENGKIDTGASNFISRELGLTYIASKDNTPKFDRTYPYPYKGYIKETFKVIEHRLDIKNIKGYECFRIVVEGLKELDQNHEILTTYEMYVTEKIKCKYHPVLEAKSFLEQYYPLEIRTSATLNNKIKNPSDYEKQLDQIFKTQIGNTKLYTLDSISIK
ncbi:hypothetical protein ACWGOQ_0002695 [Aquimarina sp. M1]